MVCILSVTMVPKPRCVSLWAQGPRPARPRKTGGSYRLEPNSEQRSPIKLLWRAIAAQQVNEAQKCP